jgi:hypothetical protein
VELVRSRWFWRLAGVLVAGCLASGVAYMLLPSSWSGAWRGTLSAVFGWLVVFLLAWRLGLGHEDVWWWPFAPPRSHDDSET